MGGYFTYLYLRVKTLVMLRKTWMRYDEIMNLICTVEALTLQSYISDKA